MKKFMTYVFGAALILIGLIVSQWPDNNLHVVFCDVGQGDAILIKKGFWQMLVDGGPDQSVMNCLSQHMPFWDKHIEQLTITHADDDHIGGIEQVLDVYQVGNVWLSDRKSSQTYQKMLLKLDSESLMGMRGEMPFLGALIDLDSKLKILSLWPIKYSSRGEKNPVNMHLFDSTETILSDEIVKNIKESENNNDRSIVLFLKFNHFKCLLMGDVSKEVELALIDKNLIEEVHALKVAHHGSNSSTSTSFLKESRPEISILSCGESNAFNHPSQEVISQLQKIGSKILRTDRKGTIELVTDGSKYWVNY